MIQKFSYHWFRIYFSSALQTTTEVGYRPWRQRLLNGSTEFQSHRVLLLQGHLVLKPRHGLLPLHLGSSFFFETGDTKDIQKHNWCTHTHDVQLIHKRYQKWCTDEIQKIHMKYTRKTNKLSWRHLDVFHVGQVCFALSLRPGVLLPPVRLEALMPMSHDAVQPPRSLVIISYIYIY